jgi:hypothetical protein
LGAETTQVESEEGVEVTHDWIRELIDRGEFQEIEAIAFAASMQTDKMITVTTDGGARPNAGSE